MLRLPAPGRSGAGNFKPGRRVAASMLALIITVLVSTGISALCSTTEAMLYSVQWTHIEHLRERGSRAGELLFQMRSNIEQPITAVLTLNTVANTAGASIAGALAAAALGEANMPAFAAAFTVLILVCGEILPKTLGVADAAPLSGLLAVMSMACALKRKSAAELAKDLSLRADKVWIAAEILLFVLVGAAVDIRYTAQAGPAVILLIPCCLLFRSAGVLLSVAHSKLSAKEKLFCVLSYLPKATVQAAIGGVPLALGLSCGQAVLSTAVMGILLSAPLGAIAIDRGAPRLLRAADSD